MSFGIPVRNGLGVGLLASTFLSSLRIGGRPAMFLNFIGTNSLDSRVTFTRGSTATFVGSDGLIQTAAINAPRFDYDSATQVPKGLLIEEARTNLLTYSQDFTDASWINDSLIITANAAASPDGTVNAETVVPTTSNTPTHRVNKLVTAVAGPAVISVFVKQNGYSKFYVREGVGTGAYAVFNIANGTVITQSGGTGVITLQKDGFYRVSLIFTATLSSRSDFGPLDNGYTSGSPTAYSFAGDGVSGVILWGAQLEAGAFATSYIPTTTIAVARNADVATMTGTNFSSWYNQSEGTFVTQFTPSTISGTRAILDANDNTANESIRLETVSADPFFTVTDGGVSQANIDAGTIAANTSYKISAAYILNDFAAAVAGGTVGADTSGTIPTVTQLQIGNSAANNSFNGCIGSVAYYNVRLTNTTIQVLSA